MKVLVLSVLAVQILGSIHFFYLQYIEANRRNQFNIYLNRDGSIRPKNIAN